MAQAKPDREAPSPGSTEVHDDLDNHPDLERRAFTSIVARRDLSTRGGPRSDRGGWRQPGPNARDRGLSWGPNIGLSSWSRERDLRRSEGSSWRRFVLPSHGQYVASRSI